jgi:pimeloyl-ACP methyl ester carboxylesterase
VTPARGVALVLITLLVLSFGYLRFAPGARPVSVPAGAQAGALTLAPCRYATEQGSYDAECGTLVVPENRANPHSRLIALPVTRIRARSAHPAEPIFWLFGGPGLSNMSFPYASRLAAHHDVVLVGFRGVDGSSVLDCPEVTSALQHAADLLGQTALRASAAAFRACAQRLQGEGVDLAGYTIPERVDDFEAARRALGYQRIDLVSESANTRTALIYAWRYPASIHRSVMIGVNPPGHYLSETKTLDLQFSRYARLCAADATCRTRTDDLVATLQQTTAHMPDRFWFLPIKTGNVLVGTAFGLAESTDHAAPMSAPMTLDSWLAAAHGDPSGFWLISTLGGLIFPRAFVWGDFASVGRIDDNAAQRYFAHPSRSIIGSPGTEFVWLGGRFVTAWPAATDEDQYTHVRRSQVQTLLIGGALDMQTPPQVATQELLPYLPHGHQVVLPEIGHALSFWTYEPQASTQLLTTFFDTGRVDTSRYTRPHLDLTPQVTQMALGTWLAGFMIGGAVLAVVSLVLMGRRVRRRGRFGRTASAVLRSVYPLVLGLGGWCLGVLVVLTALPTVPLDDPLLATLSIGLPIGLGISLAWVDSARSAQTRTTGCAAALGGALVGAWLGFHATGGLLALITTIVGATAGADLLLLALDISWDRQARDRFVEPKATERLEVLTTTH